MVGKLWVSGLMYLPRGHEFLYLVAWTGPVVAWAGRLVVSLPGGLLPGLVAGRLPEPSK